MIRTLQFSLQRKEISYTSIQTAKYTQTLKKKNVKPSKYWQNRSNQLHFMEELFTTLHLQSLEDWCTEVTVNKFHEIGGTSLLRHFKDNYQTLLSSLYPHYPWNFLSVKHKRNHYWRSLENQREYMKQLAEKFHFQTLDDFLKLNKKTVKLNGGHTILAHYKQDYKLLLKTVYPHHRWNFNEYISKSPNEWKTIAFQQLFMENLYVKLNLKSLDEWTQVNHFLLRNFRIGGRMAKKILEYYQYDLIRLFRTIYPNFPWNFDLAKLNLIYMKNTNNTIEDQRFFMQYLYSKFNLTSLDDFLRISKIKLRKNGATQLLNEYQQDYELLLRTIYPDHQWKFIKDKKPAKYWSDLNHQRQFMDEFFQENGLSYLEEWSQISIRKLMFSGGKSILQFYNNNLKLLIQSIYPYYPWQFQFINFKYKSYSYWYSIENQRKFMNNLYRKWKFKSLDDWLLINKQQIKENGGYTLIQIYKNDYKALLSAIYPHHTWNFDQLKFKPLNYWKSLANQRKFMDHLYTKLEMKSLGDWLSVNKQKVIVENGGSSLLKYYDNDIQKLFNVVYSSQNFTEIWEKKKEILTKEKIREVQREFNIRQKKDWYRVQLSIHNLYESLKLIYPTEGWRKVDFSFRSKKSKQRILLVYLQKIFSQFLLLENYRSPVIISDADREFELDIFIPSLNVAFEYQGRQHYDDMISGFSPTEYYQSRDRLKRQISLDQNLMIVDIPYWWDESLPSLLSSINLTQSPILSHIS